jgi:hypothetical protein
MQWPAYALAAALCIQSLPALGQATKYPGIWSRISATWLQDISFIDSIHGIIYEDSVYITNNGGKSWDTIKSPIKIGWAKNCVHSLVCTAPSHGIIARNDCGQLELDGDSLVENYCSGTLPDMTKWTTISMKMYDTNYGFRFVQFENKSGNPYNMAGIVVTYDAWNSYEVHGDTLYGNLTQNGGHAVGSTISGATLVDSDEVWMGTGNTIYHTLDAGAHWDTIYPLRGTIDSTAQGGFYDFTVFPQSKEIYADYSHTPLDYAYSSDYGKTWELDSIFNGKLTRLYAFPSHTIWGLLRQKGEGDNVNLDFDFPPRDLAYTSDNGKTWYVDSVTFRVDSSIREMFWLDDHHGWIGSGGAFYDTTGFGQHPFNHIWYYEEPANGVEKIVHVATFAQIPVYPDPAVDVINMGIDLDESLQLYDPLGRKCAVRLNGSSIDISQLTPGIYFIYDGTAVRAKFIKE